MAERISYGLVTLEDHHRSERDLLVSLHALAHI
jgi:hypothetical protein